MDCPACQTPLPNTARFCLQCGTKAPDLPSSEPEDPLRTALRKALGQQYEIGRLLGKGGMGAVYLAREAALERDVAIKVLPPDRGDTQDSRDRFRREARTAAKLSHPNIVPLHTFGDVDGTLYFVMGYVKGESLAARLKREARLPVEDARRILIEVAEALDYAHKLGIVHRDIKPDNVLIEESTGRAMLTDFGIAKAMGAGQTMTTAGSVIGTPQYMSPEQAQGKADIDARSDLYSLGVMGYAMLAGRLPFEGATPGDVMVQHITKEAPTLASLAPGLPVDLTSALTRCLAKGPDKRWPDARGFKHAITAQDEGHVPEDLVGASGATQVIIGILIASSMVALYGAVSRAGFDPSSTSPLANIAYWVTAWAVLAWVVGLSLSYRKGHPWREILRFAFAKPSWWIGTYPRGLRLAGDVWYRLPPDLRRTRSLGWAMLLVGLLELPALIYLIGSADLYSRTGQPAAISRLVGSVPKTLVFSLAMLWAFSVAGLFAGTLYFSSRWRNVVRRSRVDWSTGITFCFADTARRPTWATPEVAALLLPVPSSNTALFSAPASATELASSIAAAVAGLEGELAAFGGKVRDAGRELSKSVVALDGQISALAGSVDPADAERLAAKIGVLGPALSGEAEEKQQMRDLFQKQLDLLRGLQARVEGLKTRRARRLELLKGLWLQAVELRAASGDAARAGHTTDRIQKLFAQIGEHTDGLKSNTAAGDTHPLADLPTIER